MTCLDGCAFRYIPSRDRGQRFDVELQLISTGVQNTIADFDPHVMFEVAGLDRYRKEYLLWAKEYPNATRSAFVRAGGGKAMRRDVIQKER